jgi:tetratricopeptide (TPR) repeat protein
MTARARFVLTALVLVFGLSVNAHAYNGLVNPPSGDNQFSSVTQQIGPVRVTIEYSSPRVVRGKNDRRGKIWGELVPWGLANLGANDCKSCPWRAGANENTTFAVSHDVKVQGETLAAGKYGLFMIPGQDEWTIIFSKDSGAWGAFWYDPSRDALRVKTKAAKSDYHEWLSYEFTEREPAKATVALKWEDLQIPITITVDNPDQIYVDMMRAELESSAGFNWQNWQAAADFCAQKKINLKEGLKWAERAVSDTTWFGGVENFNTLMTLSRLQAANGMDQEAAKTFDKALNHPTAGPIPIHMAGRQLLTEGKKEQAMKVFQLNAKRFPNQWPVHVGLMRGYAALGEWNKAIAESKLALAQAPDPGNKKNIENMQKLLEEHKDIN